MRVCVTNEMDDVPSCTVRNKHLTSCDGFVYRVVDVSGMTSRETWKVRQRVQYVVAGRTVDVECRGCFPMRADHGYLCWSCWEKWRDALTMSVDMITHLRSVERAQQVDTAGVRAGAGWVIPVPSTWRLADELVMLLGHPAPGFPSDAGVFEVEAIAERFVDLIDADVWARASGSAGDAVRFYRTMQQAMAQHPMAEYEHRVRNVRCYKCRQKTLLWKPPLMFDPSHENPSGQVRVVCQNPACGAELDQQMYERVAVVEKDIVAGRRRKAAEDAAEKEEDAS